MDQLTWVQAIVLGISQGLTEFLPISSSAHTLILSRLLHWQDPGAAFTAVTQFGTEAAVIIYFWNDIKAILTTWWASLRQPELRQEPDARMGWYVIIGTLPIATLGIAFKDSIETTARNLWIVAAALIIMGLILGFADATAKHIHGQEHINAGRAILLGIGQALSLIPGVSRSGASITVGLLLGLKRDVAARYSFLLAIPAVLASALFEAKNIGSDAFVNWPATLVATFVAFTVGYGVISTLMTYIKSNSFKPFVWYRLVLGLVIIILLLFGLVSAT